MPRPAFSIRSKVLLAIVASLALATLWHAEPRVARLWLNTACLAAGACLLALPLGTFAATAIVKTDVPGRRFAMLLLVAMLMVPLYLVTGAWDAGFGIQGWHTLISNPHLAHEPWLAGWRAAIWVHGLAAVPWVALIVAAGLRAVEAEIEEDAALCTTPPRVLWHVTLPRVAPAIGVAALWIAIVASAEISVTDFFQVRTFAEEVYTQAALGTINYVGPPSGTEEANPLSATGLWLGLLISAALAVVALVAARRLLVDLTEPPHRPPWIWRLSRARWPLAALLAAVLLLVAGVPLANLIYKAGVKVTATDAERIRTWSPLKVVERTAAAPGEFHGPIWLSTKISTAAATAAVLIGVPLAWSIRLARRTPWLRLITLAVCFTIPGPLLGMGVIWLLNRPADSPLAFLAPLYDSNFSPWLVQTIRALPLATLILWTALASIPQVMLDTAATDRAGWWGRLLRIALPQRRSAVAAAWLLGLAIAVGELAATVLVMPPARYMVLSMQVFQLLHYGVDDRLAAMCLVFAMAIAVLTAFAAALLKRKG